MAELVDALASGASASNGVQVQVLPRAPEPNFFLKFRAHARFLLPSGARSKGEKGSRCGGREPIFARPFIITVFF